MKNKAREVHSVGIGRARSESLLDYGFILCAPYGSTSGVYQNLISNWTKTFLGVEDLGYWCLVTHGWMVSIAAAWEGLCGHLRRSGSRFFHTLCPCDGCSFILIEATSLFILRKGIRDLPQCHPWWSDLAHHILPDPELPWLSLAHQTWGVSFKLEGLRQAGCAGSHFISIFSCDSCSDPSQSCCSVKQHLQVGWTGPRVHFQTLML